MIAFPATAPLLVGEPSHPSHQRPGWPPVGSGVAGGGRRRWRVSAALRHAALAAALTLQGVLPAQSQPTASYLLKPEAIRRARVSAGPAATMRILAPGGVRVGPLGDSSVTLRRRELLTFTSRTPARVTRLGSRTRWALPYQLLVPSQPAQGESVPTIGPSESSSTSHLRLAAEIEGGGLRFRASEGAFIGTLLVGLEDVDHPEADETLPAAVHVQLVADADSVAPGELSLSHTNVSSFQPVTVKQIEARDSLRVHVRPDFDPAGTDIWLPVQRSQITLKPSPVRIQGFGLEVATLVAELPPGSRPDGQVVFTSTMGNPQPNQAAARSGVVTSSIRSRGSGLARITADCPPLLSGEAEIDFQWPLAFLIAALLGGALGGFAGQRATPRKTGRTSLRHGLSGVAVGIIVAAAYAAGMNLLPASLVVGTNVSEAAVFVIAALGGVLGLPYLKKAVPGLGRSLDSA